MLRISQFRNLLMLQSEVSAKLNTSSCAGARQFSIFKKKEIFTEEETRERDKAKPFEKTPGSEEALQSEDFAMEADKRNFGDEPIDSDLKTKPPNKPWTQRRK